MFINTHKRPTESRNSTDVTRAKDGEWREVGVMLLTKDSPFVVIRSLAAVLFVRRICLQGETAARTHTHTGLRHNFSSAFPLSLLGPQAQLMSMLSRRAGVCDLNTKANV